MLYRFVQEWATRLTSKNDPPRSSVPEPPHPSSMNGPQEARNAKADPMQYLPDDLLFDVFGHCQADLVECTRVSRTWRGRLLQLPLWKYIHVNLCQVLPFNVAWQDGFFRCVRPELRELSLTSDHGISPVVSVLAKAHCPRLFKLTIKERNAIKASNLRHLLRYRFFGLPQWDPFVHIAQRLTTLVIVSEYHQRGLLRVLLALCPQLERLEQHFATTGIARRFAMPGVSYQKGSFQPTRLRHLLWSNCHDIIHDATLVSNWCPELVAFCFREDMFNASFEHDILELTNALMFIEISCPKLTRLLVEAGDGTDFEDVVAFHGSSDTGLHYFVYTTLSWYQPEYLYIVLDTHPLTLEYINMSLEGNEATLANADTFRELPCMRRLKVSGGSRTAAHHLALFLVLCPNLQELSLESVLVVDSLCVAVPQLPIQTFHMTLASASSVTSTLDLLHPWVLACGKCPLRVLSMDASSQSNWIVVCLLLPKLGCLCTLTSLTLSTNFNWSETYLRRVGDSFTNAMKESGMVNRLQCLKINRVHYDTNAQIQQFVASDPNA
ncbi:hypothetical protein BCR43DRAFT_510917 [Syncephalastrum racemosum]|uniref:F-box domain-containing protein n=1 Tax=Syncephalastrum racemosum TaxID=13706 RepID=A0A1X2HWG6_SYNRA|nr:hypothetical protein BCR43DRAFT_510917 [Syncephalastrum racemosum]